MYERKREGYPVTDTALLEQNLVVQQIKVAAEKVWYRFEEIDVAEFCARYIFLMMKKSSP